MKQMNGMKLEPKQTNSQRLREVDSELRNLQMAGRVSQMMIQQLLQNFQNMSKDLGKAYGLINELQYKVLSMQKLGAERAGFDTATLQKYADELRLKDFVEASDAEDVKGNFTVGETVQTTSTVIVTSTTTGEDSGLFRSRIELASCGVPALIEGFAGKPVGTKVTCQLNGQEHVVELLGIRNPPPAVPVVETAPAATTDAVH